MTDPRLELAQHEAVTAAQPPAFLPDGTSGFSPLQSLPSGIAGLSSHRILTASRRRAIDSLRASGIRYYTGGLQ